MTPPSSLAALPRAAVPRSSPALPSGEERGGIPPSVVEQWSVDASVLAACGYVASGIGRTLATQVIALAAELARLRAGIAALADTGEQEHARWARHHTQRQRAVAAVNRAYAAALRTLLPDASRDPATSPTAEATVGSDPPPVADAPAALPVPASFSASGPSALPDLTPVVEDAEAAGVVRQPLITEARELLAQAERMWAVDKIIAAQLVAEAQDSLQSAIDSLIPPRLRGVKREKPVAAPARRSAE